MRTSRTPYGLDIDHEFNAALRVRRRARALAFIAISALTLLIGTAIGALAAISPAAAGASLISAVGILAIHNHLTRH